MSFVDNVERNLLFRLVRIFAFFFIIVASLVIIGAAILRVSEMVPSSIAVSQDEISEIVPMPIKKTENSGQVQQETEKQRIENQTNTRILPFTVQKMFSNPKAQEALERWLNTFNVEDQAQVIKELESVITLAENRGADVWNAIEKFQDLKEKKVQQVELEKQSGILNSSMTLAVIALSIIIIALFSLVLVLLAIERNTRKA